MAQAYQTSAPRGAARRQALLRAAITVVGEDGPDALTHRAVAERAGVPLSATTYYFDSKDDLFREAVSLAAAEEVDRLEQLVLHLAPQDLTPVGWAREVSLAVAADLKLDPARPVAFYQFVLEAARRSELRREVERWETAQLRLAEVGLRAAGSSDPETDAVIVVATITGLVLSEMGNPREHFESAVLRPALERLFVRLTQ
jgi:DNA-binding transcriptional regulator YbjK